MKWPVHGANPQYLYDALQVDMPQQTIDYSANINPLGPPSIIKERWEELLSVIADYPDPHAAALSLKLSEQEALDPTQILVGNGGAEIISMIGRMLAGKRVMIVQPAFAEYEEACKVNGCSVEYFQLIPDEWQINVDELQGKLNDIDALFITNPNNPTGVYFSKETIKRLIEMGESADCLVIVDEAFYDFVPNYENIVPFIKYYSNLLIIRSMTKMFAIPGMRLGYLMADQTVIRNIKKYQPHWSINAIALKAGEWCLEDETFAVKTRMLVQNEREKLLRFYHKNHFNISPTHTNFYLLQDSLMTDQRPLFLFLLEKGFIPRHTMNFRGLDGDWLRFAIKSPHENFLLMEAFTQWREN
ncbi:threonine-phosphate decarboxylase CobD [Cytobacillus horneckiae]|uniref:threonine-phosphate decarboxylase CobD n=1 Tax=Cytobacillus horneckiae TaxID=549687 RepID=UPI003D9A581D